MRFWKRSYLAPLISAVICLLVSVGVLVLRARGYLEAAELKTYDVLLDLRKPAAAPSPVVIVEITEPDIRAWAHYPMTDEQLAELLQYLANAAPRAIGVDVFRDFPVGKGGEWLDEVLLSNPNIVMIWKYDRDTTRGIDLVPPPPVLRDDDHPEHFLWRQTGLADFVPDAGGVARRGLLWFDDGAEPDPLPYPSLAMETANLYLEGAGMLIERGGDPHFEFWEKVVPRGSFAANDGGYYHADAGGIQFLLDYRGAWKFPHFSVEEVTSALAGGPRHDEIAAALEGKVVLIGYTAVSTKDVFPTSLFPSQRGVEIHGMEVDQLVRLANGSASLTRFWSKRAEGAWTVLWGVVGLAVGLAVRRPLIFTLVAGAALAGLAGMVYYAFLGGLWLPLVPPAMAMLITAAVVTSQAGLVERENRGALMELFAKHVSRSVARTVWSRREEFLDGGRLRSQVFETATIMFTDLQGFSSVSEQISASLLMDWLNEYMEEMSALVSANGGVVVRFMGDAMMAGFGLPVSSPTLEGQQKDAAAAVRCALGMREAAARLNARFTAEGRHPVRIRVGIHSGPVVVGSLGGRQRLEYTVVGDTVNTAARLEQYDKALMTPEIAAEGCRILISENTLALTSGQFKVLGVGELVLYNKGNSVNVFAVLS